MKRKWKIVMIMLLGGLMLNAQNVDYVKMVEMGIKAPSGHNSQPWKFKIVGNAIEIHADMEQSVPVVDPNHRELYISLGCAAANVMIAAEELGYKHDLNVFTKDGKSYINIELSQCRDKGHELYDAIEKRQTIRSVYDGKMLKSDHLNSLMGSPDPAGVNKQFYAKGENNFNMLRDLVEEGNIIQMQDEAFKEELLNWIRFNKRMVNKNGDGLSYKVMGSPAMPKFIAKPIVRSFLTPEKQNAGDMEKIASSSHFVVFTVDENSIEEWIMTGISLEYFLLNATANGVAVAFLNQPCEIKSLSEKMREELKLIGYPMLLLRIGYADKLPYSPRRGIEQVLLINNE